MGMEKFFDIVCRVGGLVPSAVVVVCTIRALKHHAGLEDPNADRPLARAALETGANNMRRHIAIVKEFGLPCVVAINRRPGDTNEEVEIARRLALEFGADGAEVNEGFERGGEGAADLARAVVEAADKPSNFGLIYRDEDPIIDKISAVARRVYGASDVYLYPEAEKKVAQYTRDGLGNLPICMAKTQYSLSADPQLLNAPENFTLPVRDIRAYTGAGWLVPLCGDIMQMPGLGKTPAAFNVDLEADGRIVGLF
jgi:formate--tetrahydrofolate ligase